MSGPWNEIENSLDAPAIAEEIRSAGKSWLDDHKEAIEAIGKDAAEAALVMGFLSALPRRVSCPSLNVKKMQASAALLQIAARNQKHVEELKESAEKMASELFESVFRRVVDTAATTLIAALFA